MTIVDRMNGDHRSVHETRTRIRTLVEQCSPEISDIVELLTDELVTNAVLHGGGQYVLTAVATDECLRVTVSDHAATPPQVLERDLERDHGRGMVIVDTMAATWGSRRGPAGKDVWFEMRLDR